MKTGLVLEGGALRTIYSCGVLDAFLDAGLPLPDYTVGVSAGAAYGASYLSRQNRRNLKLAMGYVDDPRYMGMRNLLDRDNRAYFGLKFVYETLPNELVPFDYNALEAYPGEFEAVVTSLETGKAEYWPVPRQDRENVVLQATCAIPLMFPPIELGGHPYFDGGCADPIPWKRALDVGCGRVVVILTRERAYRKRQEGLRAVKGRFHKKYPGFVETMSRRSERYDQCRAELFAREAAGDVIVIAPSDTLGVARTERDKEKLLALWQQGYFAGRKVLREHPELREA
ncbi:MAG: patatin family protein [Oscillibacter sp.]|nr:patatin family protein [Oscillibacter sp.]